MWRGYPVESYYNTCWLTGPWSTSVKVKAIMLKDAWHWGSDSSVVNDPLGEPGHSPLYAGFLSTWGSMDGDCMLSPLSWEGQSISLHRDPVGKHGVGLLYWGLRRIGELLGDM